MSLDPRFLAASKAAMFWPHTIAAAVKIGGSGFIDQAMRLLMPPKARPDEADNLQNEYKEHAAVLRASRAATAAVSDGPVKWDFHLEWRDTTIFESWSSAHEAHVRIAEVALLWLVRPLAGVTNCKEQLSLATRLLSERSKAFSFDARWVKDLQERIFRERARLVSVEVRPPEGDGPLNSRRFRLDGHIIDDLTPTEMVLMECLWANGKCPEVPAVQALVAVRGENTKTLVSTIQSHASNLGSKVFAGTNGRWDISRGKKIHLKRAR